MEFVKDYNHNIVASGQNQAITFPAPFRQRYTLGQMLGILLDSIHSFIAQFRSTAYLRTHQKDLGAFMESRYTKFARCNPDYDPIRPEELKQIITSCQQSQPDYRGEDSTSCAAGGILGWLLPRRSTRDFPITRTSKSLTKWNKIPGAGAEARDARRPGAIPTDVI